MLRLFILLILTVIPLKAAGQTTQIKISGQVTDKRGNAVEDAVVFLEKTSIDAYTDINGNYELNVAPGKSYWLVCRNFGYGEYREQIDVKNENMVINIVIHRKDGGSRTLNEVVVLGKSQSQLINESAYNVVALEMSNLYNSTMDISQALDRVSGIKIRDQGGLGSSSSISLNGFSGKHVKVFLDGVPLEGSSSSFGINNIPVNLAERIEIYKGVVPIEFGTDALGGAINIVTKKSTRTYVDASYSYGSFNTHKSNLSVGYTGRKGFHIAANAYQNYSDNNYKVFVKNTNLQTGNIDSEANWYRRFHDNYHNEAIMLTTGVVRKTWADRLLFGVRYSQEKADIQTGNIMKIVFGGKAKKSRGTTGSIDYEKKNLLIKNLDLSMTANYNITRSQNIDTMKGSFNWAGEHYVPAGSSKGEGTYSMGVYRNYNGNFKSGVNYAINRHHAISVTNTLSWFRRKATDDAANTENSTAATFMRRTNRKNVTGLSYKYTFNENWNVLAFGKHYAVRVTGPVNVSTTASKTSYEEQTRTFSQSGYGLAATYRLKDFLQFKASFEQAYRLPTEKELFGDETLETGDASLNPENSKNVNFNISYSMVFGGNHSLFADAGFVYRDTRDYIRRKVDSSRGTASYINHGKVRNLGIDGELRYFFRNNLSIGGNITYQKLQNMEKYTANNTESINYESQMPNVPYLFGGADASYTFYDIFGAKSQLTIGYNLNYVHEFYRDFKNEGGDIVIPEQLSHDANISVSFDNGRYNIAFEVRNFTNELMYDNYSLQKPGRSFAIKFRYFFNTTRNHR